MISNLLKKIFGTRNDRLVRSYGREVNKINSLEETMKKLTDDELRAKTDEFKQRLQDKSATLKDLLPEAFAVVREASVRTLGLRHFDVQLIGGMVLNDNKIAEMRTGEGKTLTSTLPVYLNALTGKGVHLVTVNDYLAQRDADWMRPIYDFLGMTVGVNLASMDHDAKQKAYAADITYGTNNEFGFDYLRDNMTYSIEERVQKPLHYAIVDEVDSILIDEARTPLIISGEAEESSDLYKKIDTLIPKLTKQNQKEGQKEEELEEKDLGDFVVDEKNRQVHLTERGHQKVEEMMVGMGLLKEGESLYDIHNITLMYYLNAALRAHALYIRDVQYVVKDDQVIIVDEHTGRLMDGRRWSEGLHQAVEAKERVSIQIENQTLATITFQNYFRMYEKLAGMTGTADTEAFEFQKIYGLEVVVIPTNMPMIRADESDKIFLTEPAKFDAILDEIKERHKKDQPILVGTASIENSEKLSRFLNKFNIKHEVLNAKQHEREAKIIANAGRPGAVTIATNMAGRGTDIVLGGSLDAELAELENKNEVDVARIKADWQKRHDAVLKAGGLCVIGTERHESRRIDNQLRGRSGRQGDPGCSQFYLSMDDNLLRIFAAERMAGMMRKLGIKEGEVIQHPWISKSVENAQRRVEGMNFDVRKQLLEYDDVANDQRKVIYQQRDELLQADDISKTVNELREEAIKEMIVEYVPPQSLEEQWDIPGLTHRIKQDFNLQLDIQGWLDADAKLNEETLPKKIIDEVAKQYEEKAAQGEPEHMRELEKAVMMQLLDHHWKEHLAAMDHLRQSIHLRGYAQKNPVQEYKRECFDMFTELVSNLKYDFISTLNKVELATEEEILAQQQAVPEMHFHHAEMASLTSDHAGELYEDEETDQARQQQPFVREQPKVGRNDPCPCNSGKKFKQCHGKLQ